MAKIRCEYKKLVPLQDLKEHPKNRNKHGEDQITRLAQIFEYQGIRHPIIVSNLSGFIVAGHGRLAAARKLGLEEFPVDYQEFGSEEEEYAFLVSDNSIALWAELDLSGINADLPDLGPDFDIDLLGIKNFKIDVAENEEDPGAGGIPSVPRTKPGDLYRLGAHRLLCGDSTMIDHVQRLMAGEKADLWIADPPFGVSYVEKNAAVHGGIPANQAGKEIKSDTKSVKELCPLWRDVATNAFVVTTMEASNYWCACQGSDKMMMMMMMMQEAGWNIRHELIWVKDSFVFGRSDYHYRHEPIIFGWKEKGTHNWYGDRKQDSVIELPRPKKSDLHPTTKPIELFERFMANSTKRGDAVLESFGGSGTTLIAAEKLGRRSFTMELDPRYCDVIVDRWERMTGQKAELVHE